MAVAASGVFGVEPGSATFSCFIFAARSRSHRIGLTMLQHAAKAIGTASCVLMLTGDATHGCNSWRIAACRLSSQCLSLFNRTEIDPVFGNKMVAHSR